MVPQIAALITSRRFRALKRGASELRRRLTFQPRRVEVFLRVGDPYSHVLAQVLPELERRFRVEFKLRAVDELLAAMTPDPERLAEWAARDASALAAQYQLAPPAPLREPHETRTAALCLAAACEHGTTAVADVFLTYAAGGPLIAPANPSLYVQQLAGSEHRLKSGGHYMSAMLHYGSEWFWGLDRLNHLEQRLIADGLAGDAGAKPRFTRRMAFLATPPTALEAGSNLTLYWSARSPYSYLALGRAAALAKAFGVRLEIRPVLPMVMRNLAVPRTKRFYILLDAKRESELLDIPYGRVCDPLGPGVERCYSVFDYAKEQGLGFEWLSAFAESVWSQGVDAATDSGLRAIASRAGLDSEAAVACANDTAWKQWAERHRLEMLELGFWGVPVLKFGDTTVWGQDRFWYLEDALRTATPSPKA